MRKAQKQEMLEMVQTLHQAHDEIKNNIDKKNYVLAQDMLSQCQECAISIGTAIEKFEGEGFVTVSFVEAYCDVLFSTYEELNGSDVNANKIYKNLKKQLLRIENSIKNDVPIRKEVAFFPYKASMWDSLESVYLAAKEDPDCDAYCVPIPYYDRNADGSLGKMHYEGREYPKNIEVIDWQTYNFEERKPDAIYIHNPYDDWNLVTCVHPRYFSANLKKYTDKLVYIPYFVLDEIEPDDQNAIDNMKHFVWTPGVVNADKVVVQSEKMKQIYINEYLKAAQKNGLQGKHTDRKYLEEKFLGTGSPKFDKVLNTKKEDLEIPEEWLRIIEKPDGSWKKIIFYNTSIAALLENNEKMLEKMKDVFRIFKENQDEVALLWRPHPLIKSTVSAMRPQLWAEYEKIVNQYKEEGWGIYDDSSDMDRAVVLSDAYYGDQSSVVQVYQKTGKKVYIQNVVSRDDFIIEKKTGRILTHFIPYIIFTTRYKDKLYFLASDYNGLFSIDLKNGETHLLCSMEDERKEGDFFGNAITQGKYIIICPFNFRKIHMWDIENKKEITINHNFDEKRTPAFLPRMVNFNEKMFCITSYGDKCFILDLASYAVIKAINIRNEYQRKLKQNYKILTKDEGYLFQNNIYFSTFEANYICEYSTEKDEILFHEINIDTNILLSIGYQENLYLLGKNNMIYVWNIESKAVRKQCFINIDEKRNVNYLQNKAIVKDDIYFMAPRSTWCIKYSIKCNQVEVNDYERIFSIDTKENEQYYFSSQDDEGNLYFISNQNNLAKVNVMNHATSIIPLTFDFHQLELFFADKEKNINIDTSIGKSIIQYLK